MGTYRFKLQSVLDYRAELEKSAEDCYLECRARRISCEQEIAACSAIKATALSGRPKTLTNYRELDRYLERLSDNSRALTSTLGVLIDEEEVARQTWLEKHKERETVSRLREADFEAWQLEENRKEQREMDEWAVLRRAA